MLKETYLESMLKIKVGPLILSQDYFKIHDFKKGSRDRSLLFKVRKQGGKHAIANIGHSI